MLKFFPALLTALLLVTQAAAQSGSRPSDGETETVVQYLSGVGKDDGVDWEFMVDGGRRAGEWTTIPVPSNWELEGFGTYNYGHDQPKANEIGHYRHTFTVPSSWEGRNVEIVFEGVMTDAAVSINGVSVGPTHQGGFYRFGYDVTDVVRFGEENLLEVDVAKMSSNASVNRAEREADFWVFGGIYRPVFLRARPAEHIAHVAVDPRHDGTLRVDTRLARSESPQGTRVVATVTDFDGDVLAEGVEEIGPLREETVMRFAVDDVEPWSPEFPNLYLLTVSLEGPGGLVHRVVERIGFRTIEVMPQDGIYLNGTKIRLKGVNRHSFWPDAGRTTSREVSVMDAQLIKDMNMNAVRMSHYPPDPHFLDAADSLGLLVINELTGWQDAYDSSVGSTLVAELVLRDHNHPSVILWANGNEGGWNRELDPLFEGYDLQKRTVIHPWELFGQINTAHYQPYNCCAGTLFHGNDIFMPTEFLHGLYDGGLGAGLEDHWKAMMDNPLSAGGFLWVFADEAIVRTDLEDSLDTDGNHAPDGIVGPYREKEGSFFAIKEIWSPVFIQDPVLVPSFSGRLHVENRYHFTNLNEIEFEWALVEFPGPDADDSGHQVAERGTVAAPDVGPGLHGMIDLGLPVDWFYNDALYLTATDPHGREVFTWTWMIRSPVELASMLVQETADTVTVGETADAYILRSAGVEAEIDRATGMLRALRRGGDVVPFGNGPRLVSGQGTPTGTFFGLRGNGRYVEIIYDGDLRRIAWTMLPGGWLELSYRYSVGGEHDNVGVTFDMPEEAVESVRWLGKGPYRVWKNRTRGMAFDVWSKDYNDAVTGQRWQYPEFKGHHANTYWAALDTEAGPITFVVGAPDVFLRLFTPDEPVGDPRTTAVEFPEGDISFLNGIPPIGSKFHSADELGPQGRKNETVRWSDARRVGEFDVVIYIRPGS